MKFILSLLAGPFFDWVLSKFRRNPEAEVARLEHQQDIMEKADDKAERRHRDRVEVDRDVADYGVGSARERLRSDWVRRD